MKELFLIFLTFLFFISKSYSSPSNPNLKQLPFHFNWLEEKPECFQNQVRSIGYCHASYAFAIAGLIETRLCLLTNENKLVSPQQLISCDVSSQMCQGGNILDSLLFVIKEGFAYEEDFRYSSGSGKAPTCGEYKHANFKLTDLEKFSYQGPIMQEIMFNGPVAAEMLLYEDFLTFKGELYTHKTGSLLGKQNVLLVGWDRNLENYEEFWIVRNSMGSYWGNKGYFRIKYRELEIDSRVVTAKVSKK